MYTKIYWIVNICGVQIDIGLEPILLMPRRASRGEMVRDKVVKATKEQKRGKRKTRFWLRGSGNITQQNCSDLTHRVGRFWYFTLTITQIFMFFLDKAISLQSVTNLFCKPNYLISLKKTQSRLLLSFELGKSKRCFYIDVNKCQKGAADGQHRYRSLAAQKG